MPPLGRGGGPKPSGARSSVSRVRPFTGAWGGAILAAVLCIAYDTSGNVSALEGGRAHLAFKTIVVLTVVGAVIGLIVGALVWAARIRADTARKFSD